MNNATSKHYAFESKNMGTVEVFVDGEYVDGCKDLSVTTTTDSHDFSETDDADEVMAWLHHIGCEFESPLSEKFNHNFIQFVMIDRDATPDELLDKASGWGAAEAERYKRSHVDLYDMYKFED